MWLAVLGPLSVRRDEGPVPVPSGKLRVLLAVLLVHANQVLSFDALADALWDGAPPPAARATVRNYVKRLRQALGPEVGARIVTRDPGYLVELDDHELDLLRFAALCEKGGAAVQAGAWQQAATVLHDALALWRGAPFSDVPSEGLQRDHGPRLEQVRLQALEWRIDADLQLGRHAQVVPELQALAAAHPLRESVHVQLLIALSGCGRRAEALDAYQQARRVLVDELGIEPGPELQQLHQRILAGDPPPPPLPLPAVVPAAVPVPAVVPAPAVAPVPTLALAAPWEPTSALTPDLPDPQQPTLALRPVGAVKKRGRRADVGVVMLAIASVAALVTAVTFAVAHVTRTDPPASAPSAPSALYAHCPVGEFCLFNGKDGTTSYCTWLGSDPTADRNCDWLRHGWKVRSVYNRMSVPVEYCAQEQYKACVGSTPPGAYSNLAGTYTVRSVRVE